jgi:uncharacterized protein YerC
MKRKQIDPETTKESAEDNLCHALLAMRGVAEMRSFLRDLCTPSELEALVDRWRVVPYLLEGMAYREIHDLLLPAQWPPTGENHAAIACTDRWLSTAAASTPARAAKS